MHNLRNELMHYTNDLPDGADLKAEAVAVIERIAQYMEKDVLLHHSRPLALAYLALTEEVDSVPAVHGRWEWLGPNRLVKDCMCGTCSACKARSKYIVNTMLCPNCGAKMNGKDGGDNNANRDVD